MALARVKVWNPGDVLTASDLNGEFNNVLNNPISLVSPTTGPINFNLQANSGLLPSAITATSGVLGQSLMVTTGSTGVASFGNPYIGSRVRGLQMVASSQNAQFSGQEYVLATTPLTQSFVINSTASFTVNLATAGPVANGKDQAAQFASTYIHYYGITTGAGSTTPAGIVSSQPPSIGPTLPTGYVAWVYLTSLIYSSASTSINVVRQKGAWVWNDILQTLLSVGKSTTLAAVDNASAVPSVAENVNYLTNVNNQSGALAQVNFQYTAGSNTLTFQAPSGFPYSPTFVFPNSTTLQYVWTTNPNPGGLSLFPTGYSVPNGDAA